MTGETRDISRRQYIKGTRSTFAFDADEALGKFMITARIPTGVAEKVSTQTIQQCKMSDFLLFKTASKSSDFVFGKIGYMLF